MRRTVCVRSCTRSSVQLQRQLFCYGAIALFFIFENIKNVDVLSTAFAPWPLAPDPQNTRRARMTRRPLAAECRDATMCLCPNVLTGHKVSRDPTRQQARHSVWNYSEHLNQPQPSRNVRRPDATKSHCCRIAKSAPIGTPLTP